VSSERLRVRTVLGVLVAFIFLLVSVLAGSGGAATGSQALTAGAATFTDPTGDAVGGAPDITTVSLSDDPATGRVTVRVTGLGFWLAPEQRYPQIAVFLDTDKNQSTGDPSNYGADYMLPVERQPGSRTVFNLSRWDGSTWVLVPSPSSVSFDRSGNDGVTWTLNKSVIGGTSGFAFFAACAVYEGDNPSGFDLAPNSGTWVYDLSPLPPSEPTPVTGVATFTDPMGDGNGAPDVASVVLSSDPKTRTITVKVTAVGYALPVTAPTATAVVYVDLDTDRNQSTGAPGTFGSEYYLCAWKNAAGSYWDVARWDGGKFVHLWESSPTVRFAGSGDVLTWTLNSSDLGGAAGFNFHVWSAALDAGDNVIAQDYAPNSGKWAYELSAPAVTLKAVIGTPSTSPGKPTAGKPFTVTFPVTRSDNGAPLRAGTMICEPSVAGKVIPHNEQFKNGTARLSFVVPEDASGKLLSVKVTIKVGTRATTKVARFRVVAAPLKAVIGPPSTSPSKPVAGKRFTVTFPVTRGDNGAPLKTGTMICEPSVGGTVIRHSEQFKNGKARLTFVVPASATGKLLKVKVTIEVGTKATTRVASFLVAAPVPTTPGTKPTTPGTNRAPRWPVMSYDITTKYTYDEKTGQLMGAVTTIRISPAIDPDGDRLSYAWKATNGSIVGKGLTARWKRLVIGDKVQDGDIVVTASDGRGGTATYTLHGV
jgi:hypothetical protein